FPLHARPDEFRPGAQNGGVTTHARLHQRRGMSTGYVIFAHGSRIEAANQSVRSVAAALAQAGHLPHVQPAFLELGTPSLETAIDTLLAQGVTEIVVLPYFLTLGMHLERDLPRIVAGISRARNGLQID